MLVPIDGGAPGPLQHCTATTPECQRQLVEVHSNSMEQRGSKARKQEALERFGRARFVRVRWTKFVPCRPDRAALPPLYARRPGLSRLMHCIGTWLAFQSVEERKWFRW
jgi:hypothetical protein